MNVPAVLGFFSIARRPSLCLPHWTAPTFADIPQPLGEAFASRSGSRPEIRAVVLDKDNCFAVPDQDVVHTSCEESLQALKKAFSSSNMLIVSNSSGLQSKDPYGSKASTLERNVEIPVLRHQKPKPACGPEILAHFKGVVDQPSEIVVIGDRLFTDIAMANTMKARALWIKRGVVPDNGVVTRAEYALSDFLLKRGFNPPQL